MNPPCDARSAKIYIVFLEKRRILQIHTALPPFVKLLGTVVWWNVLLKQGKPFRLLKWKRTQQQPIDDAEHTRVRANSDCEGSDDEPRLPWALDPEPESVFEILKHVAKPVPAHFTSDAYRRDQLT
jgi:hypothetical protein